MPSNGSATVTKTPKNTKSPVEKQDTNPKHDFFWTYTEEPHRTRRMAIIKAHPEVCQDLRRPS
jgi:sphingolipid delta-4 desaturase